MPWGNYVQVAAIAVLLSGCAGNGTPAPVEELGAQAPVWAGAPSPEPAPSAGEAVTMGEAVTIPLDQGETPAAAPSDVTATPANPAVVALLNEANHAMQIERHDRAAASLERALAIEPRNAWLWHRLANTRLQQGDLGQAASLAARSNSLSTDRGLQAANWRVIAEVHRQRGELTAARSAEEKAARLASP